MNSPVRCRVKEPGTDARDGGIMERPDRGHGVPVRSIARKVPSGKTRFLRIIVVIRCSEGARPSTDARPAQWCWSTARRSARRPPARSTPRRPTCQQRRSEDAHARTPTTACHSPVRPGATRSGCGRCPRGRAGARLRRLRHDDQPAQCRPARRPALHHDLRQGRLTGTEHWNGPRCWSTEGREDSRTTAHKRSTQQPPACQPMRSRAKEALCTSLCPYRRVRRLRGNRAHGGNARCSRTSGTPWGRQTTPPVIGTITVTPVTRVTCRLAATFPAGPAGCRVRGPNI